MQIYKIKLFVINMTKFDINKKYYIQKNEAFEMEDVRFIDKNGKIT